MCVCILHTVYKIYIREVTAVGAVQRIRCEPLRDFKSPVNGGEVDGNK
jgi:hypothetical protein